MTIFKAHRYYVGNTTGYKVDDHEKWKNYQNGQNRFSNHNLSAFTQHFYLQFTRSPNYWGISVLKFMLIDKGYITRLLIGWWLCSQPIICQFGKYLLTNIDLDMEILVNPRLELIMK